ncbi:hypothetical protein [Aquilutibacter rugosus]|uniref:hypothetical protein n=1 Tax=Aquilutibacter rugosus TaxID=3115820 RepID=UPI002F3EF108
MIEIGHLAHPGTQHGSNLCTYHCDNALGAWMILDGIGGEGSAEFAAVAARDELSRNLRQGLNAEQAIRAADKAVHALPKRGTGHASGTGCLLLQSQGPNLVLNWVGAAQAFAIERRTDALSELTAERGQLAAGSRTKALGVTDSARLPIAECVVPSADYSRVLLASEPVHTLVGAERIREILEDKEISAQEMADTLIFESLEAGTEDAVAVIVLKL